MTENRLLIIDDEPAFGKMVENVALDLGYDVKVTTKARDFIDAYETFKPTIIVLDIVMPDMDGNELILWLAQRHYAENLVVITGYSPDFAANAKTLAEFKGLRQVVTLHKPVELDELRATLKGKGM